jgi:D-alanyl-D-alanine carboxypeptidase/D-alanyl-D-alanine-endopeptidase (penicillin-binding protein 4)
MRPGHVSCALLAAAGTLGALLVAPADAAPASTSRSAAVSARTDAADARIAAKLKQRLRAAALGRDVAVRVVDPQTGRLVFASQSTEAQLPASNMKLVTAVAALRVLGADRRLPTTVREGSSSSKVVLVGGGDPLLSSSDLRTLAKRTAVALRTRDGATPKSLQVQVDDRLFARPTRPSGWISSYGLGEISPVRALGRHRVASRDTALDAARYFAGRLRVHGVAKVSVGGRATGRDELARVAGHRVGESVRVMLRDSDNQVAETLFRQVAVASGRPGSWNGARAAATSALRAYGIPLAGVRLVDGSGLSRSNRLTARSLATLMRRATTGAHPELASLVGGLPLSGRTGTLRKRYRSKPSSCARGDVRAKTGYVGGVVALSGVTVAADGRLRVFSVVANRIPSRKHSVRSTQLAVDALAATINGCY